MRRVNWGRHGGIFFLPTRLGTQTQIVPGTHLSTDYFFSAAGNDTTGDGTAGAPYATIAKALTLSLSDGDRLFFRGGDTFSDALLVVPVSNLTITSYGTGKATISRTATEAITISGKTNVVIDNLNLRTTADIALRSDDAAASVNVTVSNCDVSSSGAGGIQTGVLDSHWVIDGTDIHDCGNHGLVLQGSIHEVRNSTFNNNAHGVSGGHDLYCHATGASWAQSVLIHDNTFTTTCPGSAISLRRGFTRCFGNTITVGSGGAGGINFFDESPVDKAGEVCWIYQNVVDGVPSGAAGIYIGAANTDAGGTTTLSDFVIASNTVIGAGADSAFDFSAEGADSSYEFPTNIVFRNNAVAGTFTCAFTGYPAIEGKTFDCDYNGWWVDAGDITSGPYFKWAKTLYAWIDWIQLPENTDVNNDNSVLTNPELSGTFPLPTSDWVDGGTATVSPDLTYGVSGAILSYAGSAPDIGASNPDQIHVLAVPTNLTPGAVSPSGTQYTGTTITATRGVWIRQPTAYRFEWLRDNSTVVRDTGFVVAATDNYTLVSADETHNITCRVTGQNAAGNSTPAIDAGVVNATAVPPPPTGGTQFTTYIDPQGFNTTVTLEYGTTPDALTSVSSAVAVSGSGYQAAVHTLTGLTANMPYYVRAKAVSSQGTSVSKRTLFITDPSVAGTTRYVATNGNDTTGNGQTGTPYKTVGKALSVSSAGDTILVRAGSYPGETISKRNTGLVRIKAETTNPVFANIALANAQWTSWENIDIDAHGLADVDGTHLWEAWGASSSNVGGNHYFIGGNIHAVGKTSSAMCIRASTNSVGCHFHKVSTQEGGFGVKCYAPQSPSTDWPANYYFTECDFGGKHTWDNVHLDGWQTWKFYDCASHDPYSLSNWDNSTAFLNEEHHDSLQVTYGDDLHVENWHAYDHNGAPMVTGPPNVFISNNDGAGGCTNLKLINIWAENWMGSGINNTESAGSKFIYITLNNCSGPGDGVHMNAIINPNNTADFICGDQGTGSRVTGCVVRGIQGHQAYFHATSPTIDKCHWVGDRDVTNTPGTNVTTGTVNLVSNTDNHLSNGTQLAASGGPTPADDADVPLWDFDGRGRGSTPGKGAFKSPSVASPICAKPNDPNPGGGSSGGGGTGFAPGAPANWGNLSTAGSNPGWKPDTATYDANNPFSPLKTYYDNATSPVIVGGRARNVLRGASQSGNTYWPRSQGVDLIDVTFSGSAWVATVPTGHGIIAGNTVRVNDSAGLDGTGKSQNMKPSLDKTWTVASVTATTITMTAGFTTTNSTTYDNRAGHLGYISKTSHNDTYNEVIVSETNIATAGDAVGPYFTADGTLAGARTAGADGYWVWTGGYTNNFRITGNSPGSLKIRIPGNLDAKNIAPDAVANNWDGDGQLLNPFNSLQFTNVTLDLKYGMGAFGMCGGTMSYSQSLNGSYIPVGEAVSWSGASGVAEGLMNHGFVYDANKIGSTCQSLRWTRCTNYRNSNVGTGGHTDCYQVWYLDNSQLPPDTPTWEWCILQWGGNGGIFLNTAGGGSGTKIIENTWARYCLAWKGNKFLDLAASQDVGARHCWINGDSNVQVRPEPLDFGNGPPAHPYPTGNVYWPATSNVDANLAVQSDGSMTPIDRQVIPSGSTFTYSN